MQNNPNEANRAALIGVVQNENEKMVQVAPSEGSPMWIPKTCVTHRIPRGEASVFLLTSAAFGEGFVDVSEAYSDDALTDSDDADAVALADNWIAAGTIDILSLAEDTANDDDFGESAEDDDFGQPAPEDDDFGEPAEEDWDDEVPTFTGQSVELSELDEATKTDAEIAKKKQSAAEKMAAAHKERYEASKEVKSGLESDISKAMADGKRHEDFGAWNFEAATVPMAQVHTDPVTGEVTYHIPRNPNTGEPITRQLLNPTITDDHNPFGVILNRAIGANFEHIDHPTLVKPIWEAVQGVNAQYGEEVIKFDAFSIKKGGRVVVNLDLQGFATRTRKEAASGLGTYGSYVNVSANTFNNAVVEEFGGHRMGITIMNAHDGKSALQAFMVVLRTYCGNLAMRGGVQSLVMTSDGKTKVRHMKGSVATFHADDFAGKVTRALEECYKNLLANHILRHLPVEMNHFDKMLTALNRNDLLPQPTVTVDISDKTQFATDAKGNTVLVAGDLHKQAVKIGGGHAYNAIVNGWTKSELDYVAMDKTELDKQSVGSAFHLAQCLTGQITHQPLWSDGKRVLHGKTQSVETMVKKSSKATNMLEEMAFANANIYADHTGEPVDDLNAMGDWFAENPDKMVVPVGGKLETVASLPDFTETWNVKLKGEVKGKQ